MSQEQVFRNLPVNSLEDMGSALGVSPSWPAGSDESSLAGITISLPMNVSVAAPFLHPCPDCCGLRQYPGSPPLLSPSWGPHPDTGLSAPYPLHYLGLINPPADSGQALCLLQTPKPSYPWAPLVSPTDLLTNHWKWAVFAFLFSVVKIRNRFAGDLGNTKQSDILSRYIIFLLFVFLFLKSWKYDNTVTRDLENTEQSYI